MSLWIEALNLAGDKIGDGPIDNVVSVSITRSLDLMGGVSLSLLASDPATAIAAPGVFYRVHHSDHGVLGTFKHATRRIDAAAAAPSMEITGNDELIELINKNGYFNRRFTFTQVDSVVTSLLAVAGWTAGDLEAGIGDTTIEYEGESIFESIDALRDRWRRHFRLGNAAKTLDFGEFGDDSGVRLIVPDSGIPPELVANEDVFFINGKLSITDEDDKIINFLIPVGSGQGTAQLTIELATITDPSYPVLVGVNADGSNFYYIEDAASVAAVGAIERPFVRDIRPLTNSNADLINAANALYAAARQALLKWKDARTYYKVNCTKFDPGRVRPGDRVTIQYRGVTTRDGQPYRWVDLDASLFVMDITETYSQRGGQSVTLNIASANDRRTSDADMITKLSRDVQAFKLKRQPGPTHSPAGPYTKSLDAGVSARFTCTLGPDVLSVHSAKMTFTSGPFVSKTKAAVLVATTTTDGAADTTPGGEGGSSPGGGGGVIGSTAGQHVNFTEVEDSSIVGLTPVYLDDLGGGFGGKFVAATGSGDSFVTTEDGGTHGHDTPDHSHSVPAHNHTVPAHEHTVSPGITISYGLFPDTETPDTLTVTINGTDRTIALGGPWAVGGGAITVSVDIEPYLLLNSDNPIIFSAAGGQGDIEYNVDRSLTVQAIIAT